jgi:hypothetical protein
MAQADDYVYNTSFETTEDNFTFLDRSIQTPVIDLNNGNYSSGQVIFNLGTDIQQWQVY